MLLMDIDSEKLFKETKIMLTDQQFTCLVDKYIDTVFRVALNYLKDPMEAEDITQNVFEKLLRNQKPFESEAHVKHWLIRVTINECKHLLRAPWRQNLPLEEYAGTLAFDTPERSELFYAVMDLPKKFRLPIYLHYYEGYSTKEIAGILKIPLGTVCTNLKRGRELLKKTFKEAKNDV